MYITEINKTIEDMFDDTLRLTLLSSLANQILFTVIIGFILISFVVFMTKPKENRTNEEYKSYKTGVALSTTVIIIVLSVISYAIVQKDYNNQKNILKDYKQSSQFTEGRKKLDTPYWNYDLDVTLNKYISELPLKKTKDYTDFNYNAKGNVEFYFNGKLREIYYPELLTLVEDKKPILLYKEIDKDIHGIYKKGDIAEIKFITNY